MPKKQLPPEFWRFAMKEESPSTLSPEARGFLPPQCTACSILKAKIPVWFPCRSSAMGWELPSGSSLMTISLITSNKKSSKQNERCYLLLVKSAPKSKMPTARAVGNIENLFWQEYCHLIEYSWFHLEPGAASLDYGVIATGNQRILIRCATHHGRRLAP